MLCHMQKPTHYQKMVHATSHSSIIWQIRDSTANTPAAMSTSAAGCHPPPTVHLCAYNLLKIGLLICKTSNADKTGLHFKNICSQLYGGSERLQKNAEVWSNAEAKTIFFTDNRPFFQASRTRFERNNFETDSSSLKMSNASKKKQAA